jgi:hypothetical protein
VFFGVSNELGNLLNVPVTPYLYIADKRHSITQVWAGYAPDQDGRLLKTAIAAAKDQNSE